MNEVSRHLSVTPTHAIFSASYAAGSKNDGAQT